MNKPHRNLNFEEKYGRRVWRLHGGLLDGLCAALPIDAADRAEVYHHRISDGRVFEYEFTDHGILRFIKEVEQIKVDHDNCA